MPDPSQPRRWGLNRLADVLTVLVFVTSGCAGVTISPVNGSDGDSKARGFRYYETAPYLLVHTDGQGSLTTKLLFLPDLTRKMSARPYNFMASNQVTLKFTNGVLTTSSSTVDETIVPKAVLAALETAAVAATKAALNLPESAPVHQVPQPYLYKITATRNAQGIFAWELRGGQADGSPINVSVPTEKK